jgi:hypothetical protein
MFVEIHSARKWARRYFGAFITLAPWWSGPVGPRASFSRTVEATLDT